MSSRYLPVWSVVFWVVAIFQVSILPDTLGIGLVSRVVNTLTLVGLLACSLGYLAGRMSERVLVFYCFPVGLIILGYLVNIVRSLSLEELPYLGLVLPWAAALSVPFTRGFDSNHYWRLFYRFMLVISIIALVEYAAVFLGFLGTTAIKTSRGEFLKGIFTIFHGLDDPNEPVYDRMYGVFAEPGTCAMFLLPALAYALVYRRILGVIVFLWCMALTVSLGGYIGLVVLLLTFVYWETRNRSAVTAIFTWLCVLIALSIAAGSLYGPFTETYAQKGESAILREDNVTLFFSHFLEIVFQVPFGMDLTGHSLSDLAGSNRLFIGTTFSIGNALEIGGLSSFLGYTMFLIVNTMCWLRAVIRRGQTKNKALACVCISFPAVIIFVVQRTTLFDSALYSFLFAGPILGLLRRDSPEDRPDAISLAKLASDYTRFGG
jgi:hypothetical protein